jgi:leucyl/phenylalanyl-tRNA--protein transferase
VHSIHTNPWFGRALSIGAVPVEPAATSWEFPDPSDAPSDLVAVGADLEPGTLLTAYRRGMFPMPDPGARRSQRIAWFSPDPRGVLPLDGLRISRSLRRSLRRYEIRRDTCFSAVISACADPARPGAWITPAIVAAYTRLHELGFVHSLECIDSDGELAGGLYGVRIDRFFAGEAMFSRQVDASKVALVALVEWLTETEAELLDVQWTTPHLASLGAVDIPRRRYLGLLQHAVERSPPQ